MAPIARPLTRCSRGWAVLRWGALAALLAAPAAGWGQLVPETSTYGNTSTTVINNNGVATVSGGQRSGDNINLFHRFSTFNTSLQANDTSGLTKVYFDLANPDPQVQTKIQNLIVGVTSAQATISVPLVLSSSANLIFMSPLGIKVTGGAAFGVGGAAFNDSFSPLANVSLSNGSRLIFKVGGPDSAVSGFFDVNPQQTNPYPNGFPDFPTGLSAPQVQTYAVILDGESNGPVSLQVDRALMVASLDSNAAAAVPNNILPVQVKGQVTLKTGATGMVFGAFRLGEWLYNDNSWSPATLIADSSAGSMTWMAPVEVNPGSQFVLSAESGSIDLRHLVKLKGLELNEVITFASLASNAGTNAVSGGVVLSGPGRIAVSSGSLAIEGSPTTGIDFLVVATSLFEPNGPYGSTSNAYNLLFDIASGAEATVNGAIVLGSGGVTKIGGGDLSFNSDFNSYTGPTNVEGGYLQVNGSMPETATCSNGGSSNLCLAPVQETFSALEDDALPEVDDGAELVATGSEAGAEETVAPFDADTGEGAISAQDLEVEVAVNDSFEVADAADDSTDATSASVDSEGGDAGADSGEASAVADNGGAAVSGVNAEQASEGLARADAQSTKDALQSLAPEMGSGGIPPTPTPQQLQSEMQRQVQQIRGGVGGSPRALRRGPGADEQAWIASTDLLAAGPLPPSFQRASYQPAIIHLRFSDDRPKAQTATGKAGATDAFLDITLVPLDGPVEGRRVELSKKLFTEQLRQLYTSLSRQDSLDVANPKAPARELFNTLLGPIAPVLQARGVTTLLIAADRGLQAVPFAALHDGSRYLGDRYAFAITPSLALTNLNADAESRGQTLLAAGASRFDGLAPLPLVPQELDQVGDKGAKDLFLNSDFTPEVLLEKAGDPRYGRVHVATHAEFLPGGPAASYLYSGVGPIPLSTFSRLRQQRKGAPLDLISFSACRTALGDPSSELGFAGLAVQAGARSAAGTLWYVDDVATSAYFQQMYRYLGQGVPKAEALQLTRQAFLRGLVRLDGDRVLGPDGTVLLQNLTSVQQRRVRDGLQNPYFWGGIELVGAPW